MTNPLRRAHFWLFGAAFAVPAIFLVSTSEGSTGSNYDLPGMNFDLWCQEQAHLSAQRCDMRLSGDENNFEVFRDKVDRYEIPYLRRQQRELSIHRDIMENDPVDSPTDQATEGLNQHVGAPPF